MSAHLEVLARVLVLVRRTNNGVYVLLGWERHWANNTSTRTGNGLDDLLCRSVDSLVIIGLQPNADFVPPRLSSSSLPHIHIPGVSGA